MAILEEYKHLYSAYFTWPETILWRRAAQAFPLFLIRNLICLTFYNMKEKCRFQLKKEQNTTYTWNLQEPNTSYTDDLYL
jgi:hypothetical protein